MIHKTLGISLNYFKYREYSIIVRIYTQRFGLQSYLVRGANRRHPKIAFFQPLSLLDIVMRYKATRGLQYISELYFWHMYRSIPFDMKKSPYVLFISGLLSQLIESHQVPQETDPRFDFLVHSLRLFDEMQDHYLRFCVQFLSKLSYYAGIGLGSIENIDRHLRLWEQGVHRPLGHLLYSLYRLDYDKLEEGVVTLSELKVLWHFLIHYYRLHLQEIRSFLAHDSFFDFMT